ncbi:class I SAM-dependent methyltransferase [Candidatus Saccharibacteria bacterium]|nr:class I SAM-dependent methyltransferase [Candidatus Saccharibacteria bacterium]MCL1962792.1 class I SAM-dependent methyltransferase [Candidatus Saccharibacteria bacterium]
MRQIFNADGSTAYNFYWFDSDGDSMDVVKEVPYGVGNDDMMRYTTEQNWNCTRDLGDDDGNPPVGYTANMYMHNGRGLHTVENELATANVLLDYGSGSGRAIHRALWRSIMANHQTSFIGVDIAYDKDNEIILPQPNILQLTNNVARIPDESVDLIFACYSIFYHCRKEDLEREIREISRIAKKGAILRSEIGEIPRCAHNVPDQILIDNGWAVKRLRVRNSPKEKTARFARKIGGAAIIPHAERDDWDDRTDFDYFDSLAK